MCKYCEKGKKIEEVENDNIYFTIFGRFLRVHGRVLSIPLGRTVPIEYCPMCRKEAGRVKVLKKGKYQKENIITCEKCGCEFQYYDTEIIVDMTTPDEESFLGGFGVHKYLKCPTCNAICTISTDFIEHKSIFTEIKEWWKDLFYASTSKEDKQ